MSSPKPVPDERHVRPFTEFLLAQRHGQTHDELSQALDDLVQAVGVTGKPGTMTLQISVKPLSKGQTDILNVGDKIAVKLPARERAESVYFVDHDGHLATQDPRQLSLELHEVPTNRPSTADKLKDAK